jgi:hypothetical protein
MEIRKLEGKPDDLRACVSRFPGAELTTHPHSIRRAIARDSGFAAGNRLQFFLDFLH